MTDKYTLQQAGSIKEDDFYTYWLFTQDDCIARIQCTQATANLLDKCLNQTSRAGRVTSQAKREASKKNIAKRWNKNEVKRDSWADGKFIKKPKT